jgi:PTH1 family peptidyl-tRNA hydrolase
MEELHLIAGLGNPGREYARTRHNAGFRVVERLACRWRAAWASEKKFHARLAWADPAGRRVLLAMPQSYMNASGEAVGALLAFYRVLLSRLLVVTDDADLPLGRLRLKPGGGTAGHHGLESIQQHVGSPDYARQRLGIGRRAGAREITGHVLGRFDSTELALVDKVVDVACDQVECWLRAGAQTAMNQFNGVIVNLDPGSERTDQ